MKLKFSKIQPDRSVAVEVDGELAGHLLQSGNGTWSSNLELDRLFGPDCVLAMKTLLSAKIKLAGLATAAS